MENKVIRLSEMSDVFNIEFDKWIEGLGFYEYPASLKFHGCEKGGLYNHSKEVATQLLKITNEMDLEWERTDSPIIVGMLHDICKCDDYIWDPVTNDFIWNKNAMNGHGIKSIMMLANQIELTSEEKFCILYHMGAFTEKDEWKNYTAAVKKYPNVLWTHTADMYASQVLEV